MSRPLVPLVVSAKVNSCRAWVSSVSAYVGSVGRNTIDEAAMAAAVSAATSVPGQLAVMRYTGRAMPLASTVSGAPQ